MKQVKSLNLFSLALFCTISLSACSSWMGDEEETKLEGERVSVLQYQKDLEPAPELKDANLSIPDVWENKLWPQTAGYPNHVMENLSINYPLKKEWSVSIGSGADNELPLITAPIVAENVVYTLDLESRLSAFDIAKGKEKWQVRISPRKEKEETLGGGLAFSENRLFVTAGYNEILCLDPVNGGMIWRYQTTSPLRAAPTVYNGRVFIVNAENETVALSADKGELLWSHSGLKEKARLIGASSPAVSRNTVIVPYTSGEVFALRVENGQEIWNHNLAQQSRFESAVVRMGDIKAAPVVENGVVYVISFSGNFLAISENTGEPVWQQKIGTSQTPIVAGDYIFLINVQNEVYALEKKTGKIAWVKDLPRYINNDIEEGVVVWQGPVLANGKLLFASNNEELVMIDYKTGEITDTLDVGYDIQIPLVISNNKLFLLSQDGTLIAYE